VSRLLSFSYNEEDDGLQDAQLSLSTAISRSGDCGGDCMAQFSPAIVATGRGERGDTQRALDTYAQVATAQPGFADLRLKRAVDHLQQQRPGTNAVGKAD
jgi:hypothetical protein